MDSNNIMENKAGTFVLTIGIIIGFLFLLSTLNSTKDETENKILSTVYTTTTANVRTCASLTCSVAGTYSPNESVDITYLGINDISQLPEWISFNYPSVDGGPNDLTGYINKIVLSDHKTTQFESIADTPTLPPGCPSTEGFSFTTGMSCSTTTSSKTQPEPTISTTNKDLTSIVKEWRKSTAFVDCEFYTTYNQTSSQIAISGSGLIVILNGSPTVVTNKHVVNYFGYTPYNCYLKFPDDSFLPFIFNNDDITIDSNGLDVAYIKIPNDQLQLSEGEGWKFSLKDRSRNDSYLCKQPESIGDPIVILGYPSYGSSISAWGNNPVEVTATEGIISGKDGIYYTTSAKIEHGNSGGLAIDKNNDCYFGIPTWDQAGKFESLGRILPSSLFLYY